MQTDLPFLPGDAPPMPLPLGRFLPQMPAGMLTAWLRANIPPGEWVIDPLGATPAAALEAANAGYRVLAVINNPVIGFMLDVLAAAAPAAQMQSAIAELAASRRGDERLEQHIQSLYTTECPACKIHVPASGYLWRRGEEAPYMVELHCPRCGKDSEYPPEALDLERLKVPGNAALHRARAVDRISLTDADLRQRAHETLEAYLNRPLYALFIIINKIDGLAIHSERRRLLHALALSLCDEASSLWQHPAGRTRPRQLTLPGQFREHNLWQSLESAANLWCSQPSPLPVTRWPEPPPATGGIAVYRGRMKALPAPPTPVNFKAVVSAIPRPNQAFWTFSALWSGWLWGQEAVLPLKNALERRRYDWDWHTSALHATFSALNRLNPSGLPMFGILPDAAPGFLTAAVLAAEAAGFHLEGAALQADEELVQFSWRTNPDSRPLATHRLDGEIHRGVAAHLTATAEPAAYLPLHTAALVHLTQNGVLPANTPTLPEDLLSGIQRAITRTFTAPKFLRRQEGAGQSVETGLWWFETPPDGLDVPLTDRIEKEIILALQKGTAISLESLLQPLCVQFPGLSTPPLELIQLVLQSYATPLEATPGSWSLPPTETPAARRADLLHMRQLLCKLAVGLGLTCTGENPLVWQTPAGEPRRYAYLLASSIVSRYVLDPAAAPGLLVLPGSRSSLLAYKLRRDPRLAQILAAGWQVIKFRQLRRIAQSTPSTMEQFNAMLTGDPVRAELPSQMTLL